MVKMSKIYRLPILLFLIFLCSCSSDIKIAAFSFRDEPYYPYMWGLYQDKAVKKLRYTFDDFLKKDKFIMPKIPSFDKRYLSLFKEKFFVLEIKNSIYDGYIMTIAFAPQKKLKNLVIWQLLLEPNYQPYYEIKNITEIPVDEVRKYLGHLLDKRNKDFWI
jgi:hypothetical protein